MRPCSVCHAHATQPAIARQLSQHCVADETTVALPRSGGPIPVFINSFPQAAGTTGAGGLGGGGGAGGSGGLSGWPDQLI